MFNINDLNEQQKQAVITTDGPILVVAGAGSGKTRALTHRIYHLVVNGVNPGSILAITFTNKATNEMKERLSIVDDGTMQISTFHAFCAKVLRQYIHNLEGYNKFFTIYNEDEKNKLIKKIIKDLNLETDDYFKDATYHIANAKNNGLTPEEYLQEFAYVNDISEIVKIYALYEQQLASNNALDFDDLLTKTYFLLLNHKEVLAYLQNKYRYIHVDEFQDTNLIQYKILKILAIHNKNLFVVGDEDQCIYSWRGASSLNTQMFIRDFNPLIIKLEQNYRSTKNILEIANKLIINNNIRVEKTLWTNNEDGEKVKYYKAFSDHDEAEYVARSIYNLINTQGMSANEIAILFRMGALSRLFEEKLLTYNIPFVMYGGFKFFERAEVRNVMSYLWLLYNPNDNESIKRIINFPKRGIGKTSIEKIENLSQQHSQSMFHVILNIEHFDLNNATINKFLPLKALFEEIAAIDNNEKPSKILHKILEITNLKESYNKNDEEELNRLLNIGQLEESIASYEHYNQNDTLIDFLQSVTLQSADEQNEEEAKNAVKISTVHASKGLEFKAVFVVGAEEGLFPISRAFSSEADMEEERRLMYVAVTRSKQFLTISSADSRYLYNARTNMQPSRFIKEMELMKPAKQFSGLTAGFGGNNYNSYESGGGGSYSASTQKINAKMNNYTGNGMNFGNNLQAIINTKLKNQTKNYNSFTIGTSVLHPKFGVGEIVKSYITEGNNSVEVKFTSYGVKVLNLEFAPLQIITKK